MCIENQNKNAVFKKIKIDLNFFYFSRSDNSLVVIFEYFQKTSMVNHALLFYWGIKRDLGYE